MIESETGTLDRGGNLPSLVNRLMPEYIGIAKLFGTSLGREVAPMTTADIILIFIGVIGLMIAFGSFVIALLAFLDRD